MIVLREEQVQYILEDLEQKGIRIEELRLSLLDHICCVLEEELDDPEDFRSHYEHVLPRFFKKELSEIQEETELLIRFKNYYAMKRTMLISAGFTASTFITGALFKIMHWPGANALILASITVLCFLFLPILFVFKTKEAGSTREKITLGIATLFGIMISLATLFKLLHWPGADVMWLSSLGLLFFIFLPIFFLGGIRNKETKFNTIISSVLILVAIGLLFALTQIRYSKWTVFTEAQADVSLIEVTGFISDTSAAPTMSNDKAAQLIQQIRALRKGLFNYLNSNLAEQKQDVERLKDMGKDISLTHTYFYSDDENPRTDLVKLTESLNEYTHALPKEVIAQLSILNTERRKRYGEEMEETISWEEAHFSHVTLSVAIRNLSALEMAINATK